MTDQEDKFSEINQLINGAFNPPEQKGHGLKDLFDQKLSYLNLSQNGALDILGIELRTLNGILDGTQKRVDFLALKKIALFLEIKEKEVISLFMESLEKNFSDDLIDSKVKDFILRNFDLVNLKKCGFIEDISDYKAIEKRIVTYFGYDSIFDYGKVNLDVAYSSGKPKPKNELTRNFWVESCAVNLNKINNYYDYDRAKLVDYFPNIRWHSMNEEKGLFQVIRDLFKIGITVIFEPYINTLYVRGATFSVKNKPCIVLTNYTDYYPSLWFALIHELHHVLFDWDDIVGYQLSGEDDLFSMREVEANNFAREYLFSNDKMKEVIPQIDNRTFVSHYAKSNNVHPSLVYIFYNFDNTDIDKKTWGKYQKLIPRIDKTIESLNGIPWQNRKAIKEIANQRREKLFNNL